MTKIIADTTSSLPLELAKQRDIPMIAQQVVFGEQSFRDTELTTAEFLRRLKSSAVLPKTAAPIHTDYKPFFSDAAKSGETILVIAPSSKISGTVRSAETAMQDFPGLDIRVIDTLTVAGCLGSLVLEADEMAKKGLPANEIESRIKELAPRARTYFVVDTLEYLQKGGRIGAARALVGELLQVKPILQIKDGQASPFEQERTKKRALARLMDIASDQITGVPDPRLSIMHIDAEAEALAIRDELGSRLKIQDIPVYLLPPAIVVHAGPKALAVAFFGKPVI